MLADISTLKDIHAAYVRGSVPTFEQESDDIMTQPFADEVIWRVLFGLHRVVLCPACTAPVLLT